MKLPNIDIDLDSDEIMNDPDKKAKILLYFAIVRIIITLLIPVGIILLILIALKII